MTPDLFRILKRSLQFRSGKAYFEVAVISWKIDPNHRYSSLLCAGSRNPHRQQTLKVALFRNFAAYQNQHGEYAWAFKNARIAKNTSSGLLKNADECK